MLCQYLTIEYGREMNENFCQWEKLAMKMADFSSHRRFSLRCLSEGLIPVSVKLRTNIRTPKGQFIIRKAEKPLLNERIRSINNTITMLKMQVDTCINQLNITLDKKSMDEYFKFIESKRELRHQQTMKCQIRKFEILQNYSQIKGGHSKQHGNHDHANKTTIINNKEDGKTNHERDQHQDPRWVHNISSTTLTDAQMRVLSRGPNFTIVPQNPPVGEYIASIENACSKLKQGKADELRGEMKAIIKKINTPKNNITKEEKKALVELRKDTKKTILTADKGVSLVVMNKEDYQKKALELLDQPTYKAITTYPTTKYKNRLISLLKTIMSEGRIDEVTYKMLYPTGAGTPKFYGLPKVHKAGMPHRPIVSSIRVVSYETSKELSRILKPLVGQSPYYVHNNKKFLH